MEQLKGKKVLKENKVEVKYLGFKSDFDPPKPAPFGRNKWIRLGDGDKIESKGTILRTTFYAVLVTNGVEGEPFSYTKEW